MEKPEIKLTANNRFIRYLLVLFLGGLTLTWLVNTPPGLMGKSDALAYAVCHRIGSHSHYFGERPFSLCARCTGQYLGFLWGFGYQLVRAKKRAGFPPPGALVLLIFLFLLYLLDGLNSVIHLYPGLAHLSVYQPDNTLRLFTGLGFGIVISSVLFPLAWQTVWSEISTLPVIRKFWEWLILLGGALGIGLVILTGNPLLTYPLILLSTAGLLILLTVLYSVIWILVRKKENSFKNWSELAWWGIAGLSSALLQIALIDLVRFTFTGTWSGFLDY